MFMLWVKEFTKLVSLNFWDYILKEYVIEILSKKKKFSDDIYFFYIWVFIFIVYRWIYKGNLYINILFINIYIEKNFFFLDRDFF